MPLVPLSSLDDRRLEPYRQLKFTSAMNRSGLFVAEGDKLVRRLLRSRFGVHSVLVGERFLACGGLEIPAGVTSFVVPDALLREVVGFKFHRGVLACGYRGSGTTLRQVLDEKSCTATGHIVACIDIQDPTNLGTILRTAEAFDVAAVLLGGHCADPFSRRVLRVSMGAPFQLPLVQSPNLATELVLLRQHYRATLIAALADPAAEPFHQVHRPSRIALLLGNESEGLNPQWVELCDRKVTIPMRRRADSLNVAVATGILLHHFCGP